MKKHSIISLGQNCKKAFTQAEAAAVLVLLGIIAAITIPSLINNHQASVKRVKLKNSLTTYKLAVKSMISENHLTSTTALDNWAAGPNNDCAPAKSYFKVVETLNGEPCIFKTPDGMWWYINSGNDRFDDTVVGDGAGAKKASMSRAIVSFDLISSSEDNNINNNTIKDRLYRKAARIDWYDTHYFVTSFDSNGAPRIMDPQYGYVSSDWAQITPANKLYAFFNKKKYEEQMATCADGNQKNCCDIPKDKSTTQIKCYDNNERVQTIQIYTLPQCKNFTSNFNICGSKTGIIDTWPPIDELCEIYGTDSGLCEAKGSFENIMQNLYGANYNKNDFVVSYSSNCENMLGDKCASGDLTIAITQACKNNAECIAKYSPFSYEEGTCKGPKADVCNNMKATGIDISNINVSSLSMHYGCYGNLKLEGAYVNGNETQCTGGYHQVGNTSNWEPTEGYSWPTEQLNLSYTDTNGKSITVSTGPDGYTYIKTGEKATGTDWEGKTKEVSISRKCKDGGCSCCSSELSSYGQLCMELTCPQKL